MNKLRRDDILFPELSYEILGYAFEVFNQLGPGHAEKTYHNGMKVLLKNKQINFRDQVHFPVKFQDKIIGKSVFDFLVEGKIIVEIKKDVHYSKAHLEQVLNYLKVSNLKLGILINFTNNGVTSKRIINTSQEK